MKKKIINGIVSVAMAAAICVPTVLPNTTNIPMLSDVSVVQVMDADAASYKTGTYKVNTSSGLNVRATANTNGSKLGAATNGTQFTVTKVSGNWGYGTIKCTNGTKTGYICLDYCKYIGETYSTPLENGAVYFISPACATGSVLDVSGGGKNNGSNVLLWSKHNDKNQQFMAIKKDNYYIFKAVHSGKVLDISGGAASGKNVAQWDAHNGDNQSWYLCDAGNGYYYIKSKMNTNVCLDVCNGSNKNGTNICAWNFQGSNNQKFKFTKVQGQSNNNNNNSKTRMSYGLYNNNSAKLTCKFDGYTTTKGRHEGIDFSLWNGANVYSLTDGTVTGVVYGSNGSNGLSTIAIYVPSKNKTVIYLHCNPSSLKEGQQIRKGQQIGTQGWRGVSSSSGSHTHVEVRNGKQTRAAKSVNDYNLENPNPASFWESMGYSIS